MKIIKNQQNIALSIKIIVVFIFISCFRRVEEPEPETKYSPILIERSVLENSFKVETPREVIRAGKIYYKDNYLLINELYKGIHVYDISNPKSPVAISFIKIIGYIDMAIRGNYLYVDNAVD
jgi:hypothetical protein